MKGSRHLNLTFPGQKCGNLSVSSLEWAVKDVSSCPMEIRCSTRGSCLESKVPKFSGTDMKSIVGTDTLTLAWQEHDSPFRFEGAYHTHEEEQECRPLD